MKFLPPRSYVMTFVTGCLFVLLPAYFIPYDMLANVHHIVMPKGGQLGLGTTKELPQVTQFSQKYNHVVASRQGQVGTSMNSLHAAVGRSYLTTTLPPHLAGLLRTPSQAPVNTLLPPKPNRDGPHIGRASGLEPSTPKQVEASSSGMMKNNHSANQVIMTTLSSGIMLKTPARKRHIYIYPMGRIGNCLFQIASVFGLAQRYPHHVTLGNGFKYLASVFPNLKELPFIEISDKVDGVRMGESGFAKYTPRFEKLADMDNVLIVAYLQSFKYFSDYENDVRTLFQFSDTLIANATQTLADIRRSYIGKHGPVSSLTYVGLHIRKGDMTNTGKRDYGYRTADSEYIYKSMFYFQRKYKDVVFVLRTDTPNWSQDNVFLDAVFDPPAASAAQDLALLSLCNHTITSVGTYSWWAGWLAGGEVAYYHEPVGKDSALGPGFVAEDFFPPHWLPVSKMTRQDIERVVEAF